MTTFEITELPKRCHLLISGVLVNNYNIANKYPVSEQANFRVYNPTIFHGRPFDFFKYKIYIDDKPSVNQGTVTINLGEISPTAPVPLSIVKTMNIFEAFSFLNEVVPQDPGVDKIKITSIEGKGAWITNNGALSVNDTFFYYELESLIFIANMSGLMNDYSILKWTTSYAGIDNAGENQLKVNVTSLGGDIIVGTEQTVTNVDTGIESTTIRVIVNKAISNVPLKISVDTSAFLNIGTPDNTISYSTETPNSGVISVLGVTDIIDATNSIGEMEIYFTLVKNTVTTEPIPIVINLLEIDSTIDNVNLLNNQVTIFIPITPTP